MFRVAIIGILDFIGSLPRLFMVVLSSITFLFRETIKINGFDGNPTKVVPGGAIQLPGLLLQLLHVPPQHVQPEHYEDDLLKG